MPRLHVGVVFGGRSGEHEVSLASAASVIAALEELGHAVVPLGIARSGRWVVGGDPLRALAADARVALPSGDADGAVKKALADRAEAVDTASGQSLVRTEPAGSLPPELRQGLDVVVIMLHGPYGEDGTIQGLFELADVPYVGASVLASAVGMDKVTMKAVFQAHGLPMAEYVVVHRHEWRSARARVAARGASPGRRLSRGRSILPQARRPAGCRSSGFVGFWGTRWVGRSVRCAREREPRRASLAFASDGRAPDFTVEGRNPTVGDPLLTERTSERGRRTVLIESGAVRHATLMRRAGSAIAAAGVVWLVVTAGQAMAQEPPQITPNISVTPSKVVTPWIYQMAIGAAILGAIIVLVLLASYMRFSPKFFGRQEVTKAPPGARPQALMRQALRARAYSVIAKPVSKNVVLYTVVRALVRAYGSPQGDVKE